MTTHINDLDSQIKDLFIPQVEQLGIALECSGEAFMGHNDNDIATSQVWIRPLGHMGVITSHRILVKRDLLFYEQGVESLCIGSLSAASLALCPIVQPDIPRPQENTAVFGQNGRQTDCWLRAETQQDAISIMLLPTWFDHWDKHKRDVAHLLMEEPGEACEDTHSETIASLIRHISPLFGGIANERSLHTMVTQAALLTIDWRIERDQAEAAAGCHEQAQLVRAAKRIVELNIGESLSLETLARDLLSSRTRLCAAFKCETGESLGAYIRRRKMNRACDLLRIRKLSVTEVAHLVGYDHPSSFTVAFERELGMPPQIWRKQG